MKYQFEYLRFKKVCATLVVPAMLLTCATGEILVQDQFNYTVGQNIAGQNGGIGWTGGWNIVDVPGPIYSHNVTTGFDLNGGALNVTITGSISGNGVKVRRTLANPISAGVVWGSVMVRANGAVVDGDFFVETAPVFNASVGKKWGTDFSLGIPVPTAMVRTRL